MVSPGDRYQDSTPAIAHVLPLIEVMTVFVKFFPSAEGEGSTNSSRSGDVWVA